LRSPPSSPSRSPAERAPSGRGRGALRCRGRGTLTGGAWGGIRGEEADMQANESIRSVLARERAGGRVTVRGWLRTARHSKEVSFLEVNDGSCMAGLQVVAGPALQNFEAVRALRTGCAVEASGELSESQGRGQRFEVQAERIALVG